MDTSEKWLKEKPEELYWSLKRDLPSVLPLKNEPELSSSQKRNNRSTWMSTLFLLECTPTTYNYFTGIYPNYHISNYYCSSFAFSLIKKGNIGEIMCGKDENLKF